MLSYSLITAGSDGTGGAAVAGQAPLPAGVGVEALGAALAARPRVALQADTGSWRALAGARVDAPHGAAVARLSCKREREAEVSALGARGAWVVPRGWV